MTVSAPASEVRKAKAGLIAEFLADPVNRETSYPMNGLPVVSDGILTSEEEQFAAVSSLKTARNSGGE